MERYVVYADIIVNYDKDYPDSLTTTDSSNFIVNPSYSNEDFDEVCLKFRKVTTHNYDLNKVVCKADIKIYKPDSKKEIFKLTTYMKLKKLDDIQLDRENLYQKDLAVYEGKIKILIPII